jgi:hypothetical protein
MGLFSERYEVREMLDDENVAEEVAKYLCKKFSPYKTLRWENRSEEMKEYWRLKARELLKFLEEVIKK